MPISALTSYSIRDFISFSDEVYFRFFVRQFEAVWPTHIAMLVVGVVILAFGYKGKPSAVAVAMAIPLACSALTFHFKYFAELSPIGTVFGWAFLIQILLLLVWGFLQSSTESFRPTVHAITGISISAFALIGYPLLTKGGEWGWQGAEIFGMAPDPTICLCFGAILLAARPLWSLLLLPIPLLWSFATWATLDTFESNYAFVLPLVALITLAATIWKAVSRRSSRTEDNPPPTEVTD